MTVVASYKLYDRVSTPPTPPNIRGSGELYVDAESANNVAVSLAVGVDPGAPHPAGQWPVDLTLTFVAPQNAQSGIVSVDWALVLYGDAQLTSGVQLPPPNTRIDQTAAADPAYKLGQKQAAQVISGKAYLTGANGRRFIIPMKGLIPREVFASAGAKQDLSLPKYGRIQRDPLLEFSKHSDAFDIGIPGRWLPPENFQVLVNAGLNSPDQRIDLASPSLDDPANLTWVNDNSVTALVTRTSLSAEADGARLTFVLGAVVGAGIASILTTVERLFTSFRRASRDTDGQDDPPVPPPPPS